MPLAYMVYPLILRPAGSALLLLYSAGGRAQAAGVDAELFSLLR